jgi:hypothetical protein
MLNEELKRMDREKQQWNEKQAGRSYNKERSVCRRAKNASLCSTDEHSNEALRSQQA